MIKINVTSVPVDSQEKALTFYTEILGFIKTILWTLFLQYYQGLQCIGHFLAGLRNNTVDTFSSVLPRVTVHRTLFSRSEKAQTCN